MALSSRRSGGGGGGVPLFLNVVAPATSNRASVVLRAQPKQPLFWPPRRESSRRGGGGGRRSLRHRSSRATDGGGGADGDAPSFPSPTHLVRLATREDLPALAAIERACGHYEWGPDALKHELESPLATLLVAEGVGEERVRRSSAPAEEEESSGDDKENEDPRQPRPSDAAPAPSSPISGLAIVWNVADETQILELAVHPARRRRGAARALLSAELATSPAAAASSSSATSPLSGGRAVLEVASRNEAAVALYASFGFGVDGVRKAYYRDGDDALLMSLRIGGSNGGGGEVEYDDEEEQRRRSDDGDSAPSSPPTPPG